MFGAFIGDIEGSVFEFNNTSKRNFDLYDERDFFTDDSVMTLAVMDMAVHSLLGDPKAIVDTFRKWGKRYPDAGYGGRFRSWLLFQKDYASNDSYGNGAAMRISPIGWFAKSEDEVKSLSNAVTSVSHRHPEGLKGAETTAMMVYLSRSGKTKKELKAYAESQYPLYKDITSLRASNSSHHGLEICQISVPQALSAFFLSKDFEDCLRIIISCGGDCDTTAAIACSIAEAFYGKVDSKLKQWVIERFKDDREAIDLLTNPAYNTIFHDR